MMLFISIYGVVDGLFVSNFVGKTAFAAINLVMPFVMVIGGVGFMIGTGGTALVSRVLGEGKRELANRYFTMMVWLSIIVGAVLSTVGIAFMEPVSRFLGATDAMLPDCVLYGRICIGFSVSFMLQNLFQSFLIAAEKPKLGLAATVAAGVTNMVLDALFIAGLSQCVGGILPLFYFAFPNNSLLRLTRTKLEIRPILQACGNGSSEMMNNIASSIVGMLYNFQLLKYAGEDGVSTYGVLMYVNFCFAAIFIGYSVGSAPIVGYHFGAQNRSELQNMLRKSIILMGTGGVILALAAQLLANPLAHLFVGYDAGLFAMTTHAFRLYSFAFLFMGFNIFASGFFTSLSNGGVSAAIAFLRTLVFQAAAVLILPILFELDGIWWAMTTAEVFAFVISGIFLLANRKRYGYFGK